MHGPVHTVDGPCAFPPRKPLRRRSRRPARFFPREPAWARASHSHPPLYSGRARSQASRGRRRGRRRRRSRRRRRGSRRTGSPAARRDRTSPGCSCCARWRALSAAPSTRARSKRNARASMLAAGCTASRPWCTAPVHAAASGSRSRCARRGLRSSAARDSRCACPKAAARDGATAWSAWPRSRSRPRGGTPAASTPARRTSRAGSRDAAGSTRSPRTTRAGPRRGRAPRWCAGAARSSARSSSGSIRARSPTRCRSWWATAADSSRRSARACATPGSPTCSPSRACT